MLNVTTKYYRSASSLTQPFDASRTSHLTTRLPAPSPGRGPVGAGPSRGTCSGRPARKYRGARVGRLWPRVGPHVAGGHVPPRAGRDSVEGECQRPDAVSGSCQGEFTGLKKRNVPFSISTCWSCRSTLSIFKRFRRFSESF